MTTPMIYTTATRGLTLAQVLHVANGHGGQFRGCRMAGCAVQYETVPDGVPLPLPVRAARHAVVRDFRIGLGVNYVGLEESVHGLLHRLSGPAECDFCVPYGRLLDVVNAEAGIETVDGVELGGG